MSDILVRQKYIVLYKIELYVVDTKLVLHRQCEYLLSGCSLSRCTMSTNMSSSPVNPSPVSSTSSTELLSLSELSTIIYRKNIEKLK